MWTILDQSLVDELKRRFPRVADSVLTAVAALVSDKDTASQILLNEKKGPTAMAFELTDVLLKSGAITDSSRAIASPRSSLAPDVEVSTRLRLGLIEEEVKEFRNRVFGSVDPPFKNYDDAMAWLESLGTPEGDRWYLENAQEILSTVLRVQEELPPDLAYQVEILPGGPRLEYWSVDENGQKELRRLVVPRKEPLNELMRFVAHVEWSVRLPQADILLHVLTPSQVALPGFTLIHRGVENPTGTDSGGAHYRLPRRAEDVWFEGWTLQINTADYSWEDHQKVFRLIQEQKGSRARLVKDRDVVLLDVVEDLGGVPPWGDRGEFWIKVLKACRKRGVATWSSPDAPRKRYCWLLNRESGSLNALSAAAWRTSPPDSCSDPPFQKSDSRKRVRLKRVRRRRS